MIPFPLRFEPILKERPWGRETWWISDRPGDETRVAEGPLKGKTLRELDPFDLLGRATKPFPLLVKTLETRDWLSIQAHPAEGPEKKTEAWYVLEAAPAAEILLGTDGPLDPARLPAGMRRHALRKGDAVLVPAGVPHAIGPGLVLAEIQQNSDTTWRLHDWGRTGRTLHVPEAMAAANRAPSPPPPRPLAEREIACEAFHLALRPLPWTSKGDGRCRLTAPAEGGPWVLLPACLGDLPCAGQGALLEAWPC